MMEKVDFDDEKSKTVWQVIQDFLNDFFACLFPGVFFCFFITLTLVTMHISYNPISYNPSNQQKQEEKVCLENNNAIALVGDYVEIICENSKFELLISFFVISFIFGTIFYRKDPKEPDRASGYYIWGKAFLIDSNLKEIESLAIRHKHHDLIEEIFEYKKTPNNKTRKEIQKKISKVPKNERSFYFNRITNICPKFLLKNIIFFRAIFFNSGKILDVQFPYYYIKTYLNNRGLKYLGDHITWKGNENEDETHEQNRSKMFINILKIRIKKESPRLFADVVKNEAHTRLISSLWYAVKWISRLSITLIVFSPLIYFSFNKEIKLEIFITVEFLQFLISIIILISITKFFHYQRVREIVYVLEIAHEIETDNNSIDMFKGLR